MYVFAGAPIKKPAINGNEFPPTIFRGSTETGDPGKADAPKHVTVGINARIFLVSQKLFHGRQAFVATMHEEKQSIFAHGR